MNQREQTWWVIAACTVVALLIVGAMILLLIGSRSQFGSIQEEKLDIENSITEITTVLDIKSSSLEAAQRKCSSPFASDDDRVDFTLSTKTDIAPSAAQMNNIELILNNRDWKTEQVSSATTNDIFASRNEADLSVSYFRNTDILKISGSTTCYSAPESN